MDPVYAQIELQNLHCFSQNDQNERNNPAIGEHSCDG